MQTVKTSENGNVIMTKRIAGYAVSVRVIKWNVIARSFRADWVSKAVRLDRAAAETTFNRLAA